jgi:uncharacterized protein
MKNAQTLNFALELKALKDREFEGYGSIFNNIDLGDDLITPGAFRESLADHKEKGQLPLMFWMHRPDQVPGKWVSMEEDDKGLYVKGQLADTVLGNEMRTLLGMKAVRGLSIGFRIQERRYDEDGIRIISKIDLWEVSIVSLAMNPLARVSNSKSGARLSNAGEYVPTEREFEGILRDAGCSRNVARNACARVYTDAKGGGMPRLARRDAGEVEAVDENAAELLKSINRLTDAMGSAALSQLTR